MFVGLLLLHSIVCVHYLKAKTTWWNANNASSGFTIHVWEWRAKIEKLTCCGELMFVGLLLLHSTVCVDCLKAKTTWWNVNNASSGFTTRVWERRVMKSPTSGVVLAAYKKPCKLKNLNQFE